jgi:cellulose 1,4-beta-cellobiosidase
MKKTLINLAISTVITTGFGSLAFAIDNPFVGADGYVNPDYVKEVALFFNSNSHFKERAIQQKVLDEQGNWIIPTAIWLDSRAAIKGEAGRSSPLSFYLDNALEQTTKTGKPVVVTVVVYDLPLRDCDAYSSNGEFKNVSDMALYKKEYIGEFDEKEGKYTDGIVKVFRDFYEKPNSDKVRLALIIEPDSLPNMLTNVNKPDATSTCKVAFNNHVYTTGVEYTLDQLAQILEYGDKVLPNAKGNIAMYLDIAHSGWLGWEDNANKFATIYNNGSGANGKGIGKGFDYVRGFITNTSNYSPTTEAFSYDDFLQDNKIRNTDFYAWNMVYDETSYVAEIASLDSALATSDTPAKLNNSGGRIMPAQKPYYADKHFLIDTSRNGWMVNTTDYHGSFNSQEGNRGKGKIYSRKDQRHHRGNWCNAQFVEPALTSFDNIDPTLKLPRIATTPGFGELPLATPPAKNPLYGDARLPIDAYVWIKPPGESDGYFDPNNAEKKGDQMCAGPTLNGGTHNQLQVTDSLQNADDKSAPKAGAFFERALKRLIDPKLCSENPKACDS